MNVNHNPLIRLGNQLYPIKKFLYFIPTLVLMLNASCLYYPMGSHKFEEALEIAAFLFLLLGLSLRIWVSGSSRRTVLRKKGSAHQMICRSGFYGIMRSPYFLADLVIIIGLSSLLMNPILFILSLSLFLLAYLPLVFSRESLLQNLSPDEYEKYCQEVRLIVPTMPAEGKNGHAVDGCSPFIKRGNCLS